jgi:hypothetical protein
MPQLAQKGITPRAVRPIRRKRITINPGIPAAFLLLF